MDVIVIPENAGRGHWPMAWLRGPLIVHQFYSHNFFVPCLHMFPEMMIIVVEVFCLQADFG